MARPRRPLIILIKSLYVSAFKYFLRIIAEIFFENTKTHGYTGKAPACLICSVPVFFLQNPEDAEDQAGKEADSKSAELSGQ